jgi:hypothetical protein
LENGEEKKRELFGAKRIFFKELFIFNLIKTPNYRQHLVFTKMLIKVMNNIVVILYLALYKPVLDLI